MAYIRQNYSAYLHIYLKSSKKRFQLKCQVKNYYPMFLLHFLSKKFIDELLVQSFSRSMRPPERGRLVKNLGLRNSLIYNSYAFFRCVGMCIMTRITLIRPLTQGARSALALQPLQLFLNGHGQLPSYNPQLLPAR